LFRRGDAVYGSTGRFVSAGSAQGLRSIRILRRQIAATYGCVLLQRSTNSSKHTWYTPTVASSGSSGAASATLVPPPVNYDAVQMAGQDVYWIEGRPDAGDTLMRWAPGTGPAAALPGNPRIGTSIYGYGGGAYAVSPTDVFFCHADGASVVHATAGRVQTIVAAGEHFYGDLHVVSSSGPLLAVRESTRHPHTSQLVTISPADGPAVRVLNDTSGFYAAPR
jgi:hypothetical protein